MLRKRSVAIELRLRAEAEARREAQQKLKMVLIRFTTGTLGLITILMLIAFDVLAKAEPMIEEVRGAKQFEKLIEEKDFVAVFWYSRGCRPCDAALQELETIDDDAEKFNVEFVKINDKRLAKSFGISKFPTLTFFRDGQIQIFEGNIDQEDEVLAFLTNEDSLTIPDKIEEVNAEALARIVREDKYVTVLFYDETKASADALNELENIDDEADVFKIRFVRIFDNELAADYSLYKMPCLVYFRNGIPVVYDGELRDESEVLEWLIQHQTSIDEEDVVENASKEELDIMIKNVDHLMVLFHDRKKKSQKALNALERIDDDTDKIGVSFVEVDDIKIAAAYGVEEFPTLVFFKHGIPSICEQDLTDNEEVMEWLVQSVEGADIEEVTDDMLEKMIISEEKLAVLFYEENDDVSTKILEALETIDDDLDALDTLFVKINEATVAEEYGIDHRPSLVVFEKGIPNVFEGDLNDSDQVLEWIMGEISGDHTVEVVTDAMLDKLVVQFPHVAVLFYERENEESEAILEALETIDDDMQDRSSVKMVKIDDDDEAEEYGLTVRPALVFFEHQVPNVFEGELSDRDQVLTWVTSLAMEDNIEKVTGPMLVKLLSERELLAAYFYDGSMANDVRVLQDLETIDDDLDKEGVLLVRISDETGKLAEQFRIEVVPSLVLFRNKRPYVFKGDVADEKRAISWLKEKLANIKN